MSREDRDGLIGTGIDPAPLVVLLVPGHLIGKNVAGLQRGSLEDLDEGLIMGPPPHLVPARTSDHKVKMLPAAEGNRHRSTTGIADAQRHLDRLSRPVHRMRQRGVEAEVSFHMLHAHRTRSCRENHRP